MPNEAMMAQIERTKGFIAALDQSGASTPGTLKLYGVPETAYKGDAEMFQAMHDMRVRIITSRAFTGAKVIGAILFDRTMEGEIRGTPVPTFLWKDRGVVPFLKVDQGLDEARNGVKLMKPIAGLDALLERAVALGIFGTKMRSVIDEPSGAGIAALLDQQFEVAERIARHGLVPIIEPEVSIRSPHKADAEPMLLDALMPRLDALPRGRKVMLKVSIPTVPDLYAPLIDHPNVARVVALSGGYSRREACELLRRNPGMIASFSRALAEGLRHEMSDEGFNQDIGRAVDEIFEASTTKH